MPSARFQHHALVHADPASVWAALQRAETWSGLGPVDEVWDAKIADGVLQSYRWNARAGPRRIEGSARTAEARAPELMHIDLDAGEITGRLTTELSANSEHTDLAVTLSIQGNGLLSSLFWDVIAGAIEKALPSQVEHFAGTLLHY